MPSHTDSNSKNKIQYTLNNSITKKSVQKCNYEKNSVILSNWSHWWCCCYAESIDKELRYKEIRRLKNYPFLYQSPEVHHREHLLNCITFIAESESLGRTSVHLAVYLLDFYMDNHQIAVERLELVAVVCLILACKMEEKEDKIPKITEINGSIRSTFNLKEYISLECMILTFYNWNIILPTTAHFIEYFIAEAVSIDDFMESKFDSHIDGLKCRIEGLVFDYLDITLSGIYKKN